MEHISNKFLFSVKEDMEKMAHFIAVEVNKDLSANETAITMKSQDWIDFTISLHRAAFICDEAIAESEGKDD